MLVRQDENWLYQAYIKIHSVARQKGLSYKRLFNQSSGMDQGFGADDDYNVYSKPLLDREDAAAIYRPRKAESGPTGDEQYAELTSGSKFAAPERGFAGTEGGSRPRDGPVQFEVDTPAADPFGLDKFLTDVKNKGDKNT